jgi:hypothetical protein
MPRNAGARQAGSRTPCAALKAAERSILQRLESAPAESPTRGDFLPFSKHFFGFPMRG